MRALLLWGGLTGLLLGACGSGSDPVVATGGGGIEIPNGLRVQVVDDSGQPVQGALVRRLAGSTWAQSIDGGLSVLLDSARTDASGNAVLKGNGTDAWIEIEAGSKAARLRGTDTGDVRAVVEARRSLQAVWPAGLELPRRILLSGSSRSCVPASDRSFRFDSLSQGNYALIAELSSGLHFAGVATVGKLGVERVEVSLDTSGMSIEDFEDGDILFRHSDLFGSSYWWLGANNPIGGLQTVFGNSDLAKAVVLQDGNRHLSIKVSTEAMTLTPPWASFGLGLGGQIVLPRMDAVGAVRMRVRGKGIWSLALSARGPYGYELWRKDSLPLDTVWRTVRVPMESLRQVEGVVAGTSQPVARWVGALLFRTTENAEIDVDDVVFEGLTLGDWTRPE